MAMEIAIDLGTSKTVIASGHKIILELPSGAFVISIIEMLVRYSDMFNLGWDALANAYRALPLSGFSLAWLPVSIILYALIRCAASLSRQGAK